jgi:hypothetical protein
MDFETECCVHFFSSVLKNVCWFGVGRNDDNDINVNGISGDPVNAHNIDFVTILGVVMIIIVGLVVVVVVLALLLLLPLLLLLVLLLAWYPLLIFDIFLSIFEVRMVLLTFFDCVVDIVVVVATVVAVDILQ